MSELQKLNINGLNYAVHVTGEGTPVMLLHGYPDSHRMWRKLTPLLVEAGYQVIAPDLRGFGETDIPKGLKNYKLAKTGDDCIKVLDALGINEPAYLMGHDWGAALGWSMALAYPDRFKKYVALSVGHITAFAFAGPAQLLTSWYMVYFHFKGFAEWSWSRKDYRFARKFLNFPEEMDSYVADMKRPGRTTSGMNWYRSNVIDAFVKKWPKCDIPVLGIWSDGDKFLKEKHIKKDTPKYMNAPYEYAKIEGANHWIPLQNPKAVADLAIPFFQKD
ncbi:MAG TPA: hypothetical protein DCR93_11295 [Cytophagales bacterium]|nr:hypothetical protein [Cytophagales bacterium]HAP60047.1 hypothetical protein [Cytophagales bacterium]